MNTFTTYQNCWDNDGKLLFAGSRIIATNEILVAEAAATQFAAHNLAKWARWGLVIGKVHPSYKECFPFNRPH